MKGICIYLIKFENVTFSRYIFPCIEHEGDQNPTELCSYHSRDLIAKILMDTKTYIWTTQCNINFNVHCKYL